MTNTENYGFIIPEGTDKVNLLTQNNPNWESADGIIKDVEDKSIGIATELLTSTVHALTRQSPDSAVFRFTATSNYTSGETFTVDGVQVTALLPSGEPLGNNSYIIGAEVLCCLKGTLLTFFLTSGVVSVAKDSEKLDGQLPDYYAKQSDLEQTNRVAEAAGTLATQNQQSIDLINRNLEKITNVKMEEVEIGKFNGKPIFRRVYTYSGSAIASQVYNIDNQFTLEKIDNLLKFDFVYEDRGIGWSICTTQSTNVYCFPIIEKSSNQAPGLTLRCSVWQPTKFVITLEYTKA